MIVVFITISKNIFLNFRRQWSVCAVWRCRWRRRRRAQCGIESAINTRWIASKRRCDAVRQIVWAIPQQLSPNPFVLVTPHNPLLSVLWWRPAPKYTSAYRLPLPHPFLNSLCGFRTQLRPLHMWPLLPQRRLSFPRLTCRHHHRHRRSVLHQIWLWMLMEEIPPGSFTPFPPPPLSFLVLLSLRIYASSLNVTVPLPTA